MNEQINVKILKSKLTIEDHKKILNYLNIPVFNETETTINYWTGDKNKDAYKGSPGKLVFYKEILANPCVFQYNKRQIF